MWYALSGLTLSRGADGGDLDLVRPGLRQLGEELVSVLFHSHRFSLVT